MIFRSRSSAAFTTSSGDTARNRFETCFDSDSVDAADVASKAPAGLLAGSGRLSCVASGALASATACFDRSASSCLACALPWVRRSSCSRPLPARRHRAERTPPGKTGCSTATSGQCMSCIIICRNMWQKVIGVCLLLFYLAMIVITIATLPYVANVAIPHLTIFVP